MVTKTFNPFTDLIKIGSPDTDITVPISANVNANQTTVTKKVANTSTYAPQTTTTNTRTFAPVDARSLSLIFNSPEASITKKDRVTGASSSVEADARQNVAPRIDLGSDRISPNQQIPLDISPNFSLGGDSLIPLLIIGGAVAAAFYFAGD